MGDIWRAASAGDLAEVERLVGHDPGLLDAKRGGWTPLMYASEEGHVGVVRWLLDKGAAVNERHPRGWTALWLASYGHLPVVNLLLERGGDPTTATDWGWTPLIAASDQGHLEVVRVLLGHPIAKATLNCRDRDGRTALWAACLYGHGGVARALLEGGADPTIPNKNGITPMAIAKQDVPHPRISAEGCRECVAALEVRFRLFSPTPQHLLVWCANGGVGSCLGRGDRQEAERAYLLWKARQVADQQGSGAVAVQGGDEEERALVDFTLHRLKGDLFPDLMEYMGGEGGGGG
jgi:hypothetical protein